MLEITRALQNTGDAFSYIVLRENWYAAGNFGQEPSKTASQLQGRIARAFSSNNLVKTMEMTAVIQYILTATQSFGPQDYYKKSRFTIFGLTGVLFCKNE